MSYNYLIFAKKLIICKRGKPIVAGICLWWCLGCYI